MDNKEHKGEVRGEFRDSRTGASIVKVNVGEITATITPDVVAGIFWSMDSKDQAMFFNCLALFSKDKLPFQLHHVSEDKYLSEDGRYAMSLIGDYSQPPEATEIAGSDK